MIEKDPESEAGTWKAPQCPFTIQCSLRALDDIRLAVVDAFFSLPRGGAEIGAPFAHIAVHIVKAPMIGLEGARGKGPSRPGVENHGRERPPDRQ